MTQQDPYQEPQPQQPTKRHRWLTIIIAIAGAAAAFAAGITVGADSEPEPAAGETITVEPGETQQQVLDQREQRLEEWEAELQQQAEELAEQEEVQAEATISNGIWTVGVDIEPGEYRATDVSSDCYWAILVTGSNGDIVTNGLPGGGNPTVTLEEGHDFETSRCGEWERQ